MAGSIKLDKLTLGVCYYPEHWDEALWAEDLRRMQEHGIDVIRIAEFAWNKFEAKEGVYDFTFFDRFMALVAQTGMQVIFCTPTATPPAWATHNYPEILNARKDGTLYRHGLRRHYNYNSPVYRRLTAHIVEQLARHYAEHPSIIGWQIDNEINCELNEFYSESDSVAFREFLQEKYGTLEALNHAWGAVFWNQEYTDWQQVYVPRTTPYGLNNPHQHLDYIRFISHSAESYVGLQASILRKVLPAGKFITTNGIFDHVDNHSMTGRHLDFMTYDSYPNFAFGLDAVRGEEASLYDRKWSMNLAETRSISACFGIMEQQSGPNGTSGMTAPTPKPGQMALWTMQSVAHGADFVSYFRWRTCTVGNEIYWHGLLDYDNLDNRRTRELKEVAKSFKACAEVAGSRYKAGFALLREYDNVWDAEYDRWHKRVQEVSEQGWFTAAQLAHAPMDYLYIADGATLREMQRYPVLVYPHPTIVKEETARLLAAYVEQGGTLVLGCRAGYKNENGHCVMQPKPGLLAGLAGCQVGDFTFLGGHTQATCEDGEGRPLSAPVFHDILRPSTAEVLARYKGDYYDGEAALVKNQYGKGTVYTFGAAFDRDTAAYFLRLLALEKPYRDLLELPAECELAVRVAENGDAFLFVLNYAPQPVEIVLNKQMYNCCTGEAENGPQALAAYGTRVYKTSVV